MDIYHIVDHEGFGTIHKLLLPLCENYSKHKFVVASNLITTTELKQQIINDAEAYIVIHSTGRMKSKVIGNMAKWFPKNRKAVFMHTSFNYQSVKGRCDDMHILRKLHEEENVKVLVPSVEVAEQFRDNGIQAIPIQLGIPDIEYERAYTCYRKDLEKYYNRIVTTCSSSKEIYKYIKGLDLFEQIIKKNGLTNRALIAGINTYNEGLIEAVSFSDLDFLNILCHSKMYVQCSRYETYNLTAAQAKRFKIPIVLLEAEGNKSCMGQYVFSTLQEVEKAMLRIMKDDFDVEIVNQCYIKGKKQESLATFSNAWDILE